MENSGEFNTIDDTKDVQKLIHTYLKLLNLSYRTDFDTIIKRFKEEFNFEIERDDLFIYFTPTIGEFEEDLRLQFRNLNL